MVDYVGKNSIAFMAVSGDSFGVSSRNGFLINLKHCTKFHFAKHITTFYIGLGKIFLSNLSIVMFMGLTHLDGVPHENNWKAFLFVIIVSYRICHIILGTYDHAITATLLCLAVDMDLNNSTPYFGPPKFHSMINAIDFDKFK